jgi:hypothetical protein
MDPSYTVSYRLMLIEVPVHWTPHQASVSRKKNSLSSCSVKKKNGEHCPSTCLSHKFLLWVPDTFWHCRLQFNVSLSCSETARRLELHDICNFGQKFIDLAINCVHYSFYTCLTTHHCVSSLYIPSCKLKNSPKLKLRACRMQITLFCPEWSSGWMRASTRVLYFNDVRDYIFFNMESSQFYSLCEEILNIWIVWAKISILSFTYLWWKRHKMASVVNITTRRISANSGTFRTTTLSRVIVPIPTFNAFKKWHTSKRQRNLI